MDDHIDTHDKAFFNQGALSSEPVVRFVAWCDLMGTRSKAPHAPRTVAINIGKLHDAVVRGCLATKRRVVPVAMGDGAYLLAETWEELALCLSTTFRLMALCLVDNAGDEPGRAPLCRAGVARGAVVRGTDLLAGWERRDAGLDYLYADIAKGVLLGAAAGEAYEAESCAPPFGVALHPSAHGVLGENHAPDGPWWRWISREQAPLGRAVYQALARHLEWATQHSPEWPYPSESREKHASAWKLYFKEFRVEEVPLAGERGTGGALPSDDPLAG